MVTLERAVCDLRTVTRADASAADWRWQVRGRLSDLKEALGQGAGAPPEAWLSARTGTSNRDRSQLLARVSALAALVLDRLDPDELARELARLERDLQHHLQRVHDLVYDSVALDLGGSE